MMLPRILSESCCLRGCRLRLALLVCLASWLAMTDVVQARPIDMIVIHATGGPGCRNGRLWQSPGGTLSSIRRYFASRSDIGYHYLIGRDGQIVAGVPEARIAHHARGRNETSIGIELVNDGDGHDPFPAAQIDALIGLLVRLSATYELSSAQIRGHGELDQRSFVCGGKRYKLKIDPGGEYPGSRGNFPWQRVRAAVAAARRQ